MQIVTLIKIHHKNPCQFFLVVPILHDIEAHGNNWIAAPEIVTYFSWQNLCLVFDGGF